MLSLTILLIVGVGCISISQSSLFNIKAFTTDANIEDGGASSFSAVCTPERISTVLSVARQAKQAHNNFLFSFRRLAKSTGVTLLLVAALQLYVFRKIFWQPA
jgi:hypothetical protein